MGLWDRIVNGASEEQRASEKGIGDTATQKKNNDASSGFYAAEEAAKKLEWQENHRAEGASKEAPETRLARNTEMTVRSNWNPDPRANSNISNPPEKVAEGYVSNEVDAKGNHLTGYAGMGLDLARTRNLDDTHGKQVGDLDKSHPNYLKVQNHINSHAGKLGIPFPKTDIAEYMLTDVSTSEVNSSHPLTANNGALTRPNDNGAVEIAHGETTDKVRSNGGIYAQPQMVAGQPSQPIVHEAAPAPTAPTPVDKAKFEALRCVQKGGHDCKVDPLQFAPGSSVTPMQVANAAPAPQPGKGH